jgi:hypothetical protein
VVPWVKTMPPGAWDTAAGEFRNRREVGGFLGFAPMPYQSGEQARRLAEPSTTDRLAPDPNRHAIYRHLLPVYEACEAHARGQGADPTPALAAFTSI